MRLDAALEVILHQAKQLLCVSHGNFPYLAEKKKKEKKTFVLVETNFCSCDIS